MNNFRKIPLFVLIVAMVLLNVGCNTATFGGESGTEIINAKDALNLINEENTIIVDAQNSEGYLQKHIQGSVNISRSDIVINEPVPNLLGSKEQIEEVMSKNGIANDSTVIIYDNNNNMDSARLWWTMKVYGHESIKVVSGGIKALIEANVEVTSEIPDLSTTNYVAKDKNTDMIATIEDIKAQINNPSDDTVLIDTRSLEEYNEGTIPNSVLMNYVDNNYNDGTYRNISDIRIMYLEAGVDPDDTSIMYCKTSIRGAQTYLALYNAGYTNLKLYDGAWVEWIKDGALPIQIPSGNEIEFNQQDNS